jgi:hypothetical protein
MGARDPRWGAGRGRGGRMDRPPGWAESLFAGRSRADKEADQDAQMLAMIVGGALGLAVALALNALFTAVGLQFGWWAVPVFVPLFGWLFCCAACNRVLRPVELDGLRWRERLCGAGALAVVLWLVWPLWAGPVAGAWKRGHGGFLDGGIAGPGPRYPLGAILAASPVAMGLVTFLVLALGMVLAPRINRREPIYPAPPGGPEPLRSPLLAPRPPSPRRPSPPRQPSPSPQPSVPRWPNPSGWR